MHTIEVDFEVLKDLMARRETEAVTFNDVIRRLLGRPLKVREPGSSSVDANARGAWLVKGVTFPAGSEFRATHKGRAYTGVIANGVLVVNGQSYHSPSAAAVAITGNPVNGWTFWECRRPGETRWQVLTGLRTVG